jgi:hypothetical protein
VIGILKTVGSETTAPEFKACVIHCWSTLGLPKRWAFARRFSQLRQFGPSALQVNHANASFSRAMKGSKRQ